MKKTIFIFFALFLLNLVGFSQKNPDWKWRILLKDRSYSSVLSEDKIFAAESTGNIKAFDINSGKLIWEDKTIDEKDFYDLSLFQNYLVAHNGDKNLVRILDARTGKIIRQTEPEKEMISVQTDAQGNLFVNSEKGLTAYDLPTGKTKWTNRDCENLCATDLAGDLLVQFGSGIAQILAPNDGKVLAAAKRHGNFSYLGENGDSIFLTFTSWEKKIIYAFDRRSNKFAVALELDNRDDFVSRLEGNNFYFSYLNDSNVTAADLSNGKIIWNFQGESEEKRFRTFAADKNFLYTGTDDGFLYVFEKTGGKLIWKKKYSTGELSFNFILDNFGFLTANNKIIKINLKDGKPVWTFAAFGGVENLENKNGALYFSTREGSYNAVDLKKIDLSAKAKRQFGTLKPNKNFVNTDTAVMAIGSGGGFPVERKKFSDAAFSENKAYFSITDQTVRQSLFYQLDLSNGKYRTGEKINAVNPTEPFVYKGKAYFNDLPKRGYDETDAALIAVDLETGKAAYLRKAASFSKSPTVADDIIYVAGSNNLIYGFDLRGNSVLTGNLDEGLFLDRFIAAGSENELYLREDRRTFSAFQNNRRLWSFHSREQSLTAFSEPFDDGILISAGTENLYKLDKKTGAVKWSKDYSDDLIYSIQTENDRAFVLTEASFTYWLQAVSLADGAIVWEKNINHFSSVPVLWENNICLEINNLFQCFDRISGEKTFAHHSENIFYGFSPNGVLLYQIKKTDDKALSEIQAVDLKTEKEIWKINL